MGVPPSATVGRRESCTSCTFIRGQSVKRQPTAMPASAPRSGVSRNGWPLLSLSPQASVLMAHAQSHANTVERLTYMGLRPAVRTRHATPVNGSAGATATSAPPLCDYPVAPTDARTVLQL